MIRTTPATRQMAFNAEKDGGNSALESLHRLHGPRKNSLTRAGAVSPSDWSGYAARTFIIDPAKVLKTRSPRS